MKRLTVYPDLRALGVLGASAPALNQALECWANVMAKAMWDNSKSFGKEEWRVLADVNNGTAHEPMWGNPGELLASAIVEAQALEGAPAKRRGTVARLAEKLRKLDYAHAWAIIMVGQWFWDHHEKIDIHNDAWWTLAFRKKFQEQHG
jgi:hypothetical protein